MTGDPLVSIRCTVYNHEPFLRQCLDGFVMQKTTFPFEAIVHDDASTDGSAAIIREYAEKYPDIIKPIYETENQYSKHDGSLRRIMDAAMHPNSKYIATCEGDDYWTDPNKLQLQVDFLESHPDYYMSCHAFTIYYHDSKQFQRFPFVDELPLNMFKGREYCTPSLYNFIYSRWFTLTLTIVRRNEPYIDEAKFKKYKGAYDYITNYYMMKAGKCALFKDVMGVYRRHNGGIFTGRDDIKWTELAFENYCTLYRLEKDRLVIVHCDGKYTSLLKTYIRAKRFRDLAELVNKYSSIVPFTHFINVTTRCIAKLVLGKRISKIISMKVLKHELSVA